VVWAVVVPHPGRGPLPGGRLRGAQRRADTPHEDPDLTHNLPSHWRRTL